RQAEIEQEQVAEDRVDQRPDAVAAVAQAADQDRRRDERDDDLSGERAPVHEPVDDDRLFPQASAHAPAGLPKSAAAGPVLESGDLRAARRPAMAPATRLGIKLRSTRK